MQVLCGQCSKMLAIDDDQAGSLVDCPYCSHRILVPKLKPGLPAGDLPADSPGQLDEPGEGGFADAARQQMMRRVRVICGKCGKGLSLSARLSGKRAKCPSCSTMIQIPLPDEDKHLDDAMKHIEHVELDPQEVFEPEHDSSLPSSHKYRASEKKPPTLLIVMGVLVIAGLVVMIKMPGWRAQNQTTQSLQANADCSPVLTPQPKMPDNSASATIPASMKSNGAKLDLFAAEGYHVAPPGLMYAKVDVTITAGSDMLTVHPDGSETVLRTESGPVRALGQMARKFVIPVRSLKTPFNIRPGQSESITLLFLVPERLNRATLAVGAMQNEVEFGPTPPELPADALVGHYVERPPRNLRPLLAQPIMAALQAAPDHDLTVQSEAAGLFVAIPAAPVVGLATPSGPGMYNVDLQNANGKLSCRLRLVSGGRLLVLYLSDEPFHQILYQRKP